MNRLKSWLPQLSSAALVIMATGVALAEEAASVMHEVEEIPWGKLVIPQVVNFVIFVGLLIYFIRKPLKAHFENKATEFAAARVKAEESKQAAERHHYEVEMRLRQLDQNFEKSLAEANKESEALRARLIADAKLAAQRQVEDADSMGKFEYERALSALRVEIVNASMQQAATILNKRVDDDLRSKLNDEFLQKVKPI